MNKILREIKSVIIMLLVFSITMLIVASILKFLGIYHGDSFDFLLKSLLSLALLFALVTPSILKDMRREKEEKDNELKLEAIPNESKFCNNCKFATHIKDNKYKCSEGTFKELVDGDYCCVSWEPSPIVWNKLLNLPIK